MKIIFATLLFAAVSASDLPVCQNPHEKFNACGKPDLCLPSCGNPNKTENCMFKGYPYTSCLPGCFCEDGYVRALNRKCILYKDCPKNELCMKGYESYNECGTACPLTCDNPKSKICTKQCVRGCFCNNGYVRAPNGDCVLLKDCPKTNVTTQPKCFKANESYTACGTACPRKCNEQNPPPCTLKCVPGCFCDEGYVRAPNGECVLPENCPNTDLIPQPKCSIAHESYTVCGTACPRKCNEPEPLICTYQCVAGCFCDDGYIRAPNGECVLPKNCPKPTITTCSKAHESYKACGTACPPTCNVPNPLRCSLSSTSNCVPGCFCDDGYVRAQNGDCVLLENCYREDSPSTKTCTNVNESFKECGLSCPRTCENPNPLICPTVCISGCTCNDGYVRAPNGECVLLNDCPGSKCSKPNESFSECGGSPCHQTCDNLNKPLICNASCKPGCGCNQGFVRDRNGNCVRREDCNKKITCLKF